MTDPLESTYDDLVALYHGRGKERQTIEAYREFLSRNDGYIKAWIDLGILLFQAGEICESLDCCQKVIKLAPEQTEGWRLKAMVLSDLNRSQNSAYSQLQHLRDSYKQNYSSIKALRKDLLTCYDKILRLDVEADEHDYQLNLRNKARILDQLEKHKEALALYMELLEGESRERQQKSYRLSISRQYEAMKKWSQAIEMLDPLIDAGEFHLLPDKVRILTQMKKKNEAENFFQHFLEKVDQKYEETRDVSYIFQKASGYEQLGETRKAIETLEWLLNSGIKMSLRQTADAKDGILRLNKQIR
jgi:tetratricopeptide (TPR) repeat protein